MPVLFGISLELCVHVEAMPIFDVSKAGVRNDSARTGVGDVFVDAACADFLALHSHGRHPLTLK